MHDGEEVEGVVGVQCLGLTITTCTYH